ncbi:MAG TPA: efflux RND transporter periplasmic adaptor subunit [Candidatus Kapabacteria bacterium]|nr:efflux RND transporter periplasmic adaptor subunit [Candidatus Kapabacteria bacterium]
MKLQKKHYWMIGAGVVLIAMIAMLSAPDPVDVTTAKVKRGKMTVGLDAQGEIRLHDKYTMSAPITGRLDRVVLHEGDAITSGQIIGKIFPPSLDTRQRESLNAQERMSESMVREAEARLEQVKTAAEQAKRQRERAETLSKASAISPEALENAQQAERNANEELRAAQFRIQSAQYQLQSARAARREYASSEAGAVTLKAPISGKVLRIYEKSERTVMAGAPMLDIGDPALTEVLIDVLSIDAVKIQSGYPVMVQGWGGDRVLKGRVRYVEPSAYTKISALGIEEKRVNVIAELLDREPTLGDGYRVQTNIVLWEGDNVVSIPSSALFRSGNDWAVFVIRNGEAKLQKIQVGHRTGFDVEILGGLKADEEVILHPSNQVIDGAKVKSVHEN